MGFLKKLRKRDDRFARIGKAKAAKRDAREARKWMFAEEAAKQELWELEGQCLHDTQVIFIKALHDTFGFGTKRLINVAEYVCEIGELIKHNPDDIASEEILRENLKQETGYVVDVHEVNGGPEFQIQKHAIDEISTLYLWTLHAKYGFGKARLKKMYDACAAIGSDISHGRLTMEEIAEELLDDVDLKVRMKRRKTA